MTFHAVLALFGIPIIQCLVLGHPLVSRPGVGHQRDLGGLFGDGTDAPFVPTADPFSETTRAPRTSSNPAPLLDGPSGAFGQDSVVATVSPAFTVSILAVNTATSTGQLPSSPSTTNTESATAATAAMTTTTTPSPSSSVTKSSQEWKLIGVAIITISGIATAVFLVLFFDKWWRFMRDVFVGKRRDGGSEDLVLDWEKGCWEIKEESHRYPSLGLVKQLSVRTQDTDLGHPFPVRPGPFLRSPEQAQEVSFAALDGGRR